MLDKFLDPKNDFAFKRVFGSEKNKDILIQFLNDILDHQYVGEIKDITFLPTIQESAVAANKQSIVDVLCQDQHGVQYIVEMQVTATTGFERRAQYYAAKAYSGQLLKGEDYQKLHNVIFLAITNFTMFPDDPAIKSDHIILNSQTYAHKLKGLHFTFIELAKFTKKLEELTSIREKWYYYLKHAPETTEKAYEKLAKNSPALQRAYDELEKASWSQEELYKYDQIIKQERDHASVGIAQFQKGEKKGIEKGLKKGRQEGKAEGLKEGKAEGKQQEKLEIAKQMLEDGEPIEKIKKWTGLSEQRIRSL